MLIKNEISIFDFVSAISEAVDLVFPILNSHHKKVAYIAYSIAKEMNLPKEEIHDIVLAAMLHDIGAFTIGERIKALSFVTFEVEVKEHASIGYELLKNFEPLSTAAGLIRYHHDDYNKSNSKIPLGTYIINLADRASVLLDERREIMEQIPDIMEKLSLKHHQYHPDVFFAFSNLSKQEYFLIEAFFPTFGEACLKKICFSKKIIDLQTLRSFAKLAAQIIDFRSRFTSTHSSGVAAVARQLCVISGFSEAECAQMEIAGFLHDLGKLAVPNNILEKNGKLDAIEFNFIRKHTYYTHHILSRIPGFEQIATWAAYHHERMDGSGYPFHVKEENFPILARVMAVADVITALTEDRPYRAGMEKEITAKTLDAMAEAGGLDRNIVELANDNFSLINDVRIQKQEKALNEYMAFYQQGYREVTKS
jgi:HD-GYP domain-containing protein (c-di-GMP phosphodiesterase class II)